MTSYRTEKDAMGEIKVKSDRLWGAQTQRSLENFAIGTERMPDLMIKHLVEIKRAAALAHKELGALETDMSDAIVEVCDELLSADYRDHFPLSVWQTVAGPKLT